MNNLGLAVTAYQEMSDRKLNGRRIARCINRACRLPLSSITVANDSPEDVLCLRCLLGGSARVLGNSINLGVLANKIEAVYNSTAEWVILCDSDNVIGQRYIRSLPEEPDSEVWYCPSFARPKFDYRHLVGEYKLKDLARIQDLPLFSCCLNTGNQTVHRDTFLRIFDWLRGERPDLRLPDYLGIGNREKLQWRLVYDACDSMLLVMLWLRAGFRIRIGADREYLHHWDRQQASSSYAAAPRDKHRLRKVLLSDLRRDTRDANTTERTLPERKKRLVTMRRLGCMGRAGNQFFQYLFLRWYAREHDLELQLPAWIGNELFGASEPPVTDRLPTWREPGSGLEHPTPPQGEELVGHDFHGYAQYHTSLYANDHGFVRGLLQPLARHQQRLGPAIERMRGHGDRAVIGLHIRRGDYGRRIFPLTPVPWYERWLGENLHRFYKPRLFIATEEPLLVESFDKYSPMTATSLGVDLEREPMQHYGYLPWDLRAREPCQLDFYPDFYLLSHCDVVLGGSSTFSFMAAMLSRVLAEYWRASLAAEGFVRTDPWNDYPLLREWVPDYPHLEGIRSDASNPYW